jgi:hypothetical protein
MVYYIRLVCIVVFGTVFEKNIENGRTTRTSFTQIVAVITH